MTGEPENAMEKLLAFVQELDRRRIFRRLASVRDAVMVELYLPRARREVEFFADGHCGSRDLPKRRRVLSHTDAEAALQRLFKDDDRVEARAAEQASHPRQFLSE